MKTYRLSSQTRQSLRDIARYTQRRWGRDQRIKYLAELYDRFDKAARMPLTGMPRDELNKGLRSVQQGKHVIFYRVENDAIYIVDILHHKADVPTRSEGWT